MTTPDEQRLARLEAVAAVRAVLDGNDTTLVVDGSANPAELARAAAGMAASVLAVFADGPTQQQILDGWTAAAVAE